MKKVLVVSHERAGTYFLTESISKNFGYAPYDDRIDLDNRRINWADPEQFLGFLKSPEWADIPVLNPFKSHHPRCFFEPFWDYLVEQFHIFYIYRDGRDGLVSFWNHLNKMGPYYGPLTFHPRDLISATPAGYIARYHGSPPPVTVAGRWANHIKSWLQPRWADVCYVKYETLAGEFEREIEHIASHLEVDAPEKIVNPEDDGPGGVHPWRVGWGFWREYFDRNDCDRFNLHAGDAMRLAGYIL